MAFLAKSAFRPAASLPQQPFPALNASVQQACISALAALKRAADSGVPFALVLIDAALPGEVPVDEVRADLDARGVGVAFPRLAEAEIVLHRVGRDDVLRAGGQIEEELGGRLHTGVFGVQEDISEELAERRSARLPAQSHWHATGAHPLKQRGRLRGLPASLHTFECDEEAWIPRPQHE